MEICSRKGGDGVLLTSSAFLLSLHNSRFFFYLSVQNMNLYDLGTLSGALTPYITPVWHGIP